jgi:cytochrome c biogenesis protein CcmG/thiol:disulfide interchange protein DsbE
VQRVIEALKDKNVVVLPISIDGSGENAVKPYMAKNGFTFSTLIDQRMEIARQFGVRGTPTTVVVNRDGKIVARGLGPLDLESPEFAKYLEALLAQPRG